MKKTTIYLPEDLVIEIKTVSKQDRRSEAEVIREALSAYLAQRKRPLPSVFGMGSGGSIRASESEEWLEKNWKTD